MKQALRLRHRRGQALVEFALILPLLVVLLFAIIEFGRAWNAKQLLTDATREGARLAVVGDASPSKNQDAIEARIREIVARGGFDTSTLDIDWTPGFGGRSGTITTVEVTLPYAWVVLPGLVRLLSFGTATLPPTLTLHSFAAMRIE